MVAGAVLLVPVVLVGVALSGIYAAMLYYFAVIGQPPQGFDGLVRNAFARKT